MVRIWEWLTLWPTCGPLPHTSQRLAMMEHLLGYECCPKAEFAVDR
ncbi:hypothetical protein [Alicyclobacillus tolerans]|uniref:Uncharacterized protein n=1 Tax=Alicyclobacillus tolerans TaxID=90970 RepID=A0ABT9LVZ7_9BACL|nr:MULTISPECIES: hypothetical protein [Alicyclobacillus]MDP9728438.1 hypothetical protein [Alicyclobacillus tengchongensis]